MSVEAMNWTERVFKVLDMPSADRLVLVALCQRHNKKTGACYPSVDWICKYTGLCERRVRASIRNLKKWGVISTKVRVQNGRQTSNQYFLFGVPKVSPEVDRGVHMKPPRRGAPDEPLNIHSNAPNKEGIYTIGETDCGNVVKFPSQTKGFGDV